MARRLPDAEMLVLAVVRSAGVSATFGTEEPADKLQRLPYVTVRRVGGSSLSLRLADQAMIDIQVWADDRAAASNLAAELGDALYAAYRAQTVTPYGHIASFTESSGPAEIRDDSQPDHIYRFQALYTLALRPTP